MNSGAPIHPEVLLSLADEIRQTIAWLGEQEQPPADGMTSRIRTLCEAATVAGLESVAAMLTGLDAELAGMEEPSAKIAHALDRLSTAILDMANSLESRQLEWVEHARHIEQSLDQACRELAQGTERLAVSLSALEAAAMTPSGEDRRQLVVRSVEDLRGEMDRQRRIRDRLRESVAALRTGTRKLSGDLSGLLTVPLLPVLLKLREEVRVLGRSQGKPVSLHSRCIGVEVSSRQIEPLGRVLDHLIKEAMREGIESPQQRRKAGKPTVGALRITATAGKGILEIRLQDDGRPGRQEVKLPLRVRKDLGFLRARLLQHYGQDDSQHLLLQMPVWHGSLEVVPVKTPLGELLVPLAVVGWVFTGQAEPPGDLPVVSLQRRADDRERNHPESGVVFEIEGWRGVMYAELLNTHFRVIPSQPEAGDPPWVIGRVRSTKGGEDSPEGRPVVHPLPFMELKKEQVCLFPSMET